MFFLSYVSGLIIFIKNFNLINIRSPWAPKITMFCSKVIMTKILSYQKQEALAAHYTFTSFSTRSFSMYLAVPFLHLGCFDLDSFTTDYSQNYSGIINAFLNVTSLWPHHQLKSDYASGYQYHYTSNMVWMYVLYVVHVNVYVHTYVYISVW